MTFKEKFDKVSCFADKMAQADICTTHIDGFDKKSSDYCGRAEVSWNGVPSVSEYHLVFKFLNLLNELTPYGEITDDFGDIATLYIVEDEDSERYFHIKVAPIFFC